MSIVAYQYLVAQVIESTVVHQEAAVVEEILEHLLAEYQHHLGPTAA